MYCHFARWGRLLYQDENRRPLAGFKVLPLGVRVSMSACLRLARQVGILNYEFSTAATMIPMQSVQILLNMVKKLLRVRR